jgi:hypothetical protein
MPKKKAIAVEGSHAIFFKLIPKFHPTTTNNEQSLTRQELKYLGRLQRVD